KSKEWLSISGSRWLFDVAPVLASREAPARHDIVVGYPTTLRKAGRLRSKRRGHVIVKRRERD
ncbi:hypothetical protein AB4144_60955, partial [Rhizobiaceae sp. 2RAB30]